jgi:glycerophosphoryl diester phosphodiesterase
MPAHQPLRVAHRGMPHRTRENTLESFRAALDAGAQGIELDVHCTVDDIVIVHHDPTLRGGAALRSLSLDALRSSGDHEIPTLTEVLALVGDRAEVFVEIKGRDIETQVLEVLADFGGTAAIHSFDHPVIRRIAEASTRWRLGLLSDEPVADVPALLEAHGARDYWPHDPLVTAALIDDVHAVHGRVIPWTVNDPARMQALAGMGVDAICTDDVSVLAHALRGS